MYAKKYILFILFLFIFCGSDSETASTNEESSSIFDKVAEKTKGLVDNFDDEEVDNQIISDGSGWSDLTQNRVYKPYISNEQNLNPPELFSSQWTQTNGPYGGEVTHLYKTPYAYWATVKGSKGLAESYVYKIDPVSFTWEIKTTTDSNVSKIVADSNNKNNLAFVAEANWFTGSSLYISNDEGNSWKAIELPGVNFRTIAISNQSPTRLYAGVMDINERSNCRDKAEEEGRDKDEVCKDIKEEQYILYSDDFGLSWERTSQIPRGEILFEDSDSGSIGEWEFNKINSIASDPTNNEIIYVGTNSVLAKSVDSGKTWSVLSENWYRADIHNIAIPKSSPEKIYVRFGKFTAKPCTDIDRQASNWKLKSQEFCAGVYISEDYGETWYLADSPELFEGVTGDPSEGGVYINQYDENIIYAIFARITFYSEDGGNSWDYFLNVTEYPNIPDVGVWQITSGNNKSELLLSGIQGLFRSIDHGETWFDTNEGKVGTDVVDIEIAIDGTLYATTYASGVFKSTDSGANWKLSSFGILNWYGMQLLTHPDDASIVYLTTNGGLYRTTDAGETWKINETLCEDIANTGWNCHYHGITVEQIESDHLLIGGGGDAFTPKGVGVEGTLDAGKSWFESDDGFVRDVHVSKLERDPSNPQTYYATTQGTTTFNEKIGEGQGVFKSLDNGYSWFQINSGLDTLETNVIAIDPNNSNNLYLGTDDDGLYISKNAGENWEKVSFPNTPSSYGIGDIVIDPKNSDIVYVATVDYFRLSVDEGRGIFGEYGVFKSINGGESWVEFNTGLNHPGVFSLELEPEKRILYAGTRSGGIYWISLDN